jgi:hypothetical protein
VELYHRFRAEGRPQLVNSAAPATMHRTRIGRSR